MKKSAAFLLLCIGFLFWNGCQAFEDTQFAPLEPRLEHFTGGSAHYIVLVNSSGKELNNISYRAYVYGDNPLVQTPMPMGDDTLPNRAAAQPAYTIWGSEIQWPPGKVIHFKDRDLGGEGILLRPVYRVQIIGKCDEGPFRETWVIDNAGQFHLAGASRN